MKNYSRDGKFDRGRDSRRGFGRDKKKPTLYTATCDNCGQECEIPFKPTAGKPVYCSICFERNQNEDSRRPSRERDGRRSGGRDFRDRVYQGRHSSKPSMHRAVCHSCGIECEVPFLPTKGKPIYCDQCYEGRDRPRESSTELLKNELNLINKKLDHILDAIIHFSPQKKEQPDPWEPVMDEKPSKKAREKKDSQRIAKEIPEEEPESPKTARGKKQVKKTGKKASPKDKKEKSAAQPPSEKKAGKKTKKTAEK